MKYFFILGKTPLLSFIEIREILKDSKFEKVSDKVLLTDSLSGFDIKELQEQLGGTIKIGKILGKYSKKELKTKSFRSDIINLLTLDGNRITFGFSLYGQTKKLKRFIKNIALKIKKDIKSKGISCRWVTSKKPYLSSVVLKKNNLLSRGADIIVEDYKDKLLLGYTLTCQDFKKYSFYDYSKPKRPIEKGMLPLKLSKIMINIGLGFKKDLKNVNIYDPFCGSGTILTSAILLGFKNIYGSDKDNQAIQDSKENIKWFLKNTKKSLNKAKIFQSDVRNIAEKINKKQDFIITEPYLGPLNIQNKNIKNQIDKLSKLYLNSFSEFKKIIKSHGKVVIILPVFKTNKKYFLPILDKLNKQGWKQIINLNKLGKYKRYLSQRNTLIYSRSDQSVLREILVFSYNK